MSFKSLFEQKLQILTLFLVVTYNKIRFMTLLVAGVSTILFVIYSWESLIYNNNYIIMLYRFLLFFSLVLVSSPINISLEFLEAFLYTFTFQTFLKK